MYLKRRIAVKILAGKNTDEIIENTHTSWLRSIVYKMGSQFLIDREFPLHLYFELSRACNYKCPMCMRDKAGPGGHFPEALAEKITLEAARKGPTSYSLHLFGEPLANPKWYKVVEMIRNAHPYNGILLTTNGFFMDEPTRKKLINLKVDRIFVSVNSLDPEKYKRNTGGGDISTVLNNIRTFVKMAGHSSKTKLFVRLFLGPEDPPFEEEHLLELRELGIPLEIRGFHNFAGGKNDWTTYKLTVDRWPCFHPWFTLGIAVDGRITVCCADYSFGLDVGNALDQSIEDVWHSEALQSIRREHLNHRFIKWKICEPCDTWQFHPSIFFKFQVRKQ